MGLLDLPRRAPAVLAELLRHGWPHYVRPTLREVILRPAMHEILPGIHHWTAMHPRIRQPVSSYYVEPAGMLIDPLLPREGLDWFRDRPPQQIVLTNRHHYRHSDRFTQEFGCVVRSSEPGLHEFEGGPDVEGFAFGDELAPGITAVQVGAICPDDTALHLELGDGVIALADALIRPGGGSLAFVPDFLMGDDPGAVKDGLVDSLRDLLDLRFEHLLFAHGDPLVGGGKRALEEFVEARRPGSG